MKRFHILNGDCLAQIFPEEIEGGKIIWRECLVEGPVSEADFFVNREKYLSKNFGAEEADYLNKVLSEFHRIKKITFDSEVYLWFEDDLFCQVNLWFLLKELPRNIEEVYVVLPTVKDEDKRWRGFSAHDSELLTESLQNAIKIDESDLNLVHELWNAFSAGDLETLRNLSQVEQKFSRKLREVIIANENRFNGQIIKQIRELPQNDFVELFKNFSEKYGVYGFGDLQLKKYLP